MQDFTKYLEDDFIIWNSSFGIRDFVAIGQIDDSKNAWLEEPYEMVGPFSLDELLENGKISFEQCIVMIKQTWQDEQINLRKISYEKQQAFNQHFNETINEYNKRKQHSLNYCSEREHRELLCLPRDGILKISQIKSAYRTIVKKVHPDVGGTHERFIKITQARDSLLQNSARK